MLPSFDCIYLFENPEIYILEIKRTGLPAEAIKSDIYHWLLFEKDTLCVTPFVFLALNSSDFSEERFFRKGYLSFDSDQAVFIRESSSVQNILETKELGELPVAVSIVIQQWLSS